MHPEIFLLDSRMSVMVLSGGGGPQLERDITGVSMIVEEVVLDHFTLVAQTEDEIAKTVKGVSLHYMP